MRICWRGCYAAAMSFNNRSANRKSHAHSFWPRRKKRLENAVPILFGNSCSGILNRHNHVMVLKTRRTHVEHTCAVRYGSHCFHSIHNQIEKDLAQLGLVPGKARQIISQLSSDRHSATLEFTTHKRYDIANEIVDVELRLCLAPLC